MRVGIIGNGHWGGALTRLVKREGHSVVIDDLPAGLDLWLIAVPAAYFRIAVRKARKNYGRQPIIICTKGMEPETHKFMSEILSEELPKSKGRVGILSGPQFADGVIKKVPTGSTLAGPANVRKAGRVALGEFYLEETGDIIGAELCGAGKNAAAIVAGYFSVLGKGENERAMMLARAWCEVADFGIAIGAKPRTFIGLCGTGDLFLSAASTTSRNFSAGVAIARRRRLTGTIEGLSALKGLVFRAKKIGVPTPVLNFIAAKI